MTLHPYQLEAVEAALAAPGRRWIFNASTGLGKSRMAIETLRRMGAQTITVLTMAMVRRSWEREFNKWWPDHPSVGVITHGNERKNLSKPAQARAQEARSAKIQIASYDLASEISLHSPDAVILDEVHKLKNPAAIRTKTVQTMASPSRSGACLGLSATLAPNTPADVFGPLNVIWPGRWGKLVGSGKYSFEFNRRYANGVQTDYGWKFSGLNETNADELRFRLSQVMSRVTKHEVAHLLPPFVCEPIYADIPVLSLAKSEEDLEAQLHETRSARVKPVVEWVADAQEETTHVIVLTHLKKTARELAKKLNAHLITGDQLPDERDRIIQMTRLAPKAVLVATMHSVGIGIDLTHFNRILMAELYWRPETVVQALGRFHRLSSQNGVVANMLVLNGTTDERLADVLSLKIQQLNSLIAADITEDKLATAFQGSDEDILAQLFTSATNEVYDDYGY